MKVTGPKLALAKLRLRDRFALLDGLLAQPSADQLRVAGE